MTSPARTPEPSLARRARGGAIVAVAIGALAVALACVARDMRLADVARALARQPGGEIAWSLALTAVSFAGLASYDLLGARLVAKGRVRRRVALLAGATGSAIANAVGFHAVSGTAVRARIYLAAGLSGADVARIASLSWLSLFTGNATMFAVAELLQAAHDARPGVHLALGLALAGALALLVAWLARRPRVLAFRGHRLAMPSAALALAQMLIGAVESGAAIGALYMLLPPDLAPPFSLFAIACIVAVTLGVVAHVPGGIGVFEASMTAMLAGRGRADLLAALLVYRVVYGVLPFLLSVLVLGCLEGARRLRSVRAA